MVRVSDVGSNGWNSTVHGHEHEFTSVMISIDRGRVVSGSVDKTVRVWHIANGEWRQTAALCLNKIVKFVNVSNSGDIIQAIPFLSNDSQWWSLSSAWRGLSSESWRGCSKHKGVVFGVVDSFSSAASARHTQLSSTHRHAMDILQVDLKVKDIACTADGYVFWGEGALFIGFVDIIA